MPYNFTAYQRFLCVGHFYADSKTRIFRYFLFKKYEAQSFRIYSNICLIRNFPNNITNPIWLYVLLWQFFDKNRASKNDFQFPIFTYFHR